MLRMGERGTQSGCHRRGEIVTALVVWLLMGAIVNVAVAWGCAVLIDPFRATWRAAAGVHAAESAVRNVREPWRGTWSVGRHRGPGVMRLESGFNRAESPWGATPDGPNSQPDFGDPATLVPRWSGLSEPSNDFLAGRREIERNVADARGRPMV